MENKYYTPSIEEFHHNFEYLEREDGDIFSKQVFDFKDLEVIDDQIREDNIRVKHLDREDIESLGWFLDGFGNPDYETDRVQLRYNFQILAKFNLELYTNSKVVISELNKNILFKGTIKNKSELKKLMVQLEIKTN